MRPKTKTIFHCQICGAESTHWVEKCPACEEWNTFVEERIIKTIKNQNLVSNGNRPQKISDIIALEEKRYDTQNGELNRVLGGGLVPGSVVMIAGEPGIGKSTLALQLALNIKDYTILYISGEENAPQIKLRANLINSKNDRCLIVNETFLENIFTHIENTNPDILVIDSIQTIGTQHMDSPPGSISQIRECSSQLLRFAKKSSVAVLLIGQITKNGNLAGPKILEHIVDTVLLFEKDNRHMYRILRATKNRFGSTSEMGIYEMCNNGLREINNPSELLLSSNEENLSGVAISASMEGARPFLIEVQALVSSATQTTPHRSSTGFTLKRLNMLLTVLEKRVGFQLSSKDIFLNIAGNIKINDQAIDLAVIIAVLSSNMNIPLPKDLCFAGEIGLSSEIRSVNRIDQRIKEAEKLGFKHIFVPKHNFNRLDTSEYNIEIHFVSKVEQVIQTLFKQ